MLKGKTQMAYMIMTILESKILENDNSETDNSEKTILKMKHLKIPVLKKGLIWKKDHSEKERLK